MSTVQEARSPAKKSSGIAEKFFEEKFELEMKRMAFLFKREMEAAFRAESKAREDAAYEEAMFFKKSEDKMRQKKDEWQAKFFVEKQRVASLQRKYDNYRHCVEDGQIPKKGNISAEQ